MRPLPNPDPHARQVDALVGLLLDQFKSDDRPNLSWQRRWYNSAVRIVGAVVLIAILAGMVYAALTRNP